jgi:type II secretory pathway pseudopilin PulG
MPCSNGCPLPRNSSRNDRGGFSVLELMVALLLFSALGIAMWSALSGGQNLVSRSMRVAAGTSRLLHLEQYLRRAALRVRTPFWDATTRAQAEGQELLVPWLDGQASFLRLSFQEGKLRVQAPPEDLGPEDPGIVFGPFQSAEFALYEDSAGHPAGLQVSVVAEPGEAPLVIRAAFGGNPLYPGKAP